VSNRFRSTIGKTGPLLAFLSPRLFQATLLALILFFSCLIPRPAVAEPGSPAWGGLLDWRIGSVDIKDSFKINAFSLEYTWDKHWGPLVPQTGLIVTSQTAFYAYGGLGLEFCPLPNWLIIPRFNVGLYHSFSDQGLGNTIEFFSSLEIAYRFRNHSRLGLTVGHLSNARLGLENPGTEFLFLSYTVPVDRLMTCFRQD
jgi:lipid A 3-O-deacylase